MDRDRLLSPRTPVMSRKCCGCRFWWLLLILLITVLVCVITGVITYHSRGSSSGEAPQPDNEALLRCLTKNLVIPDWKPPSQPVQPPTILIINATVWTGDGQVIPGADLLLSGGTINKIGQSGERLTDPHDIAIPANGRIVTPGLVDLHSHSGVGAFPEVRSLSETNEDTAPIFPQLRALDGVHPEDWAIPQIAQGGVTTSQILPGSANVMGGEGTVIKMKVTADKVPRVQDLLISKAPRTLKMACGENPKRVYGAGRGVTPISRLGEAWLMRQIFDEAASLVRTQNQWCSAASPSEPFPTDLEVDGLASLLRGSTLAHIHCYLVEDIEMVLRLSQEFGFKVAAFHHALEAWKIPDLLLANNITVATFADDWGFKVEAYDATVKAPSILTQAGVSVALKSDHPVLHARDLIYQAARTVHYGMDKQAALATVTRNPAAALGLKDRVGTLKVGLDADVVIWDRDPLSNVGARPDKVIIDGEIIIDNKIPPTSYPQPPTTPLPNPQALKNASRCTPNIGPFNLPCYAVTGVQVHTLDAGKQFANGAVVVENGVVTCVGDVTSCPVPANCEQYTQQGGIMIPGLIESVAHLGQFEMSAESTTSDGGLSGSGSDGSSLIVDLADGIRLNGKQLRAAWAAGLTTVVATPLTNQLLGPPSAAFYTCCGLVVDDVLVQSAVALHLSMGNQARNEGLSSTISGQFAAVRAAFSAMASSPDVNGSSILARALRGEAPIVVKADQVDVIAGLLRLQHDYPLTKMTIVGGGEAEVLASKLAAQGVSVVLYTRLTAHDFDTQRCTDSRVGILFGAGVRVGFGSVDVELSRNNRWELGIVAGHGEGVDWESAVAMGSANIADMYGLPYGTGRIVANTPANFLLFDADPLALWSNLQLIGAGSSVECMPRQY